MPEPRANYDQLASTYDQRYAVSKLDGVRAALAALAEPELPARALEVGCGTGHWLAELRPDLAFACGLDPSQKMLAQARVQAPSASLTAGRALALPFQSGAFTLVFCVNAIHHFSGAAGFAAEAWRVLAAGGQLAITGMDPHDPETRWYAYDFFPDVYARDLARYPAWDALAQILQEGGFTQVALHTAEITERTYTGLKVLDDPFLRPEATSQLAALSAAEYARGLDRIRSAAEQEPQREFATRFRFAMMVGRKR